MPTNLSIYGKYRLALVSIALAVLFVVTSGATYYSGGNLTGKTSPNDEVWSQKQWTYYCCFSAISVTLDEIVSKVSYDDNGSSGDRTFFVNQEIWDWCGGGYGGNNWSGLLSEGQSHFEYKDYSPDEVAVLCGDSVQTVTITNHATPRIWHMSHFYYDDQTYTVKNCREDKKSLTGVTLLADNDNCPW